MTMTTAGQTAPTTEFYSDANPYSIISDFTHETKKYRIKKNRSVNAPEAEILEASKTSTLIQDIVNDTEKFRLERIAHVMLRHRAETKDRIKAIMLLLESYDSLPVDMAMKTINKANELMSMNAVEDSDKVRIASAIRKLVLKPIRSQKGHGTYEELNLKYDGQCIIEVDDPE